MFTTTRQKHTMNTQVHSTPIYRTACQAAAVEGVSWTARALSRAVGKISHRHISSYAQALMQNQKLKPIIEFQPAFQTRGSLKRGYKQEEVGFTDVDTWAFDSEDCDLLDCRDDLVSEAKNDDRYNHYGYEGEMFIYEDEISEAEYDDLLDFTDAQTHSGVPVIILTTPEGEVVTGDAIPEGTKCHFSGEFRALQKQWLETIENNLVPGNWKQIRDLNRPRGREVDYAEEEALRERHLHFEEIKRKRHAERARDKERQRRRREVEAAERAWQLQRMEVEYQKQERRYRVEEMRYQAQQSQTRQNVVDLEKWVQEIDHQEEEVERRLQELRNELDRIMERDFGVESKDGLSRV